MSEKSYRSLAKAFTWRILAFADTALLTWLFTGHIGQAFAVGGAEIATKSLLYYAHERGWLRIVAWQDRRRPAGKSWRESRMYATLKAVSWRAIGSTDTFLIALLITQRLGTSASIGIAELITKTLLFYLHERAWLKSRWGTHLKEGKLQLRDTANAKI